MTQFPYKPSRKFLSYLASGGALLLFYLVPEVVQLLTDWYWFEEIGFAGIYTTMLSAKFFWGLVTGALSAAFIYGNIWAARRLVTARPLIIRVREGEANRVRVLNLERYIRTFALPVALVLGLLNGLIGGSSWETILLYANAVPFGASDPVFGRDIGFYFFTLPFVQLAVALGLWLLIASLAAAAAAYVLRGAITLKQPHPEAGLLQSLVLDPRARAHLALLAGLLFALTSFKIHAVNIPSLLYSSTGPFTGASYTDLYATLPFLRLQVFLAAAAAVLVLADLFRPSRHLIPLTLGLYVLAAVVGGWAYPAILQKFVVAPNELVKETPYITHHIEATQKSFGLDQIVERNLAGEAVLTLTDIENNQSTIRNVRLWDREPLLDTFGQLQEIRTYYDFVSVDNDRYHLNGDYRQVLLSARELNPSSLPQRTFINEHLTFTHGFGITLGPVNEVTAEGLPVLFVKDLPPAATIPTLGVKRPEIYYGELANEWVAVNTLAKEFNYPSGEENVFAQYEGSGGVPVQSFFRKLLFALRFKSLKLLLSNDITDDSRVMYYRHISARVRQALPFLHLDRDPYLVVTRSGELKWICDAYTTSDRYPYAELVRDRFSSLPGSRLNYIRNSVKVVVDAYDGKMTFYLADAQDPVIATYARIFAGAFVPLGEMDEDLRAHIRYPEMLFDYQTALYTVYHMGEPQIFYNKEDQWQLPGAAGADHAELMGRHMIMKLPGETREEYILMIPFTPRGKDNLAAWMVARNDGEQYGQLVVYRFPKQKLIFGPAQITNRINQDADISRQISLWDQRGSEVVRGNLLVIPIEESLIYIQPIYLRAEGGKIPELKRVIVAYENHIAMEGSLDEALAVVFGGQPARTEPEPGAETPPPAAALPAPVGTAFEKARNHYERALEAQRRGDWALYGEEIRKLGELLKNAK
ncbi:MAG: UPF0182 family protein [Candidatus Handelsmanbacteria bacterium]|nr:UPF0182 family protein [Candidatus Handelsmanbacteria bacterium]